MYSPRVPDGNFCLCLALLGEAAYFVGDIGAALEQTRRANDILGRTPALFRPARAAYLANLADIRLRSRISRARDEQLTKRSM